MYILGEGKPAGFPRSRGPFRDCSSQGLMLNSREGENDKSGEFRQATDKSGKSQKNRESPKRTKKEAQVQIGKPTHTKNALAMRIFQELQPQPHCPDQSSLSRRSWPKSSVLSRKSHYGEPDKGDQRLAACKRGLVLRRGPEVIGRERLPSPEHSTCGGWEKSFFLLIHLVKKITT